MRQFLLEKNSLDFHNLILNESKNNHRFITRRISNDIDFQGARAKGETF